MYKQFYTLPFTLETTDLEKHSKFLELEIRDPSSTNNQTKATKKPFFLFFINSQTLLEIFNQYYKERTRRSIFYLTLKCSFQ